MLRVGTAGIGFMGTVHYLTYENMMRTSFVSCSANLRQLALMED